MEQPWSVREDDRPYLRPEKNPMPWLLGALGVAVLAGAAGFYYYLRQSAPQPLPAAPPPRVEAAPQPAAPAPSAEQHTLAVPAPQPDAPLPTLENSDSMMRRSLADLMGGPAFEQMVVPSELVRRIVATVDNLPRQTAPRRMIPLTPVPGAFSAAQDQGDSVEAPANFDRYTPYVRVLESIEPRALVYSYARAYPLFQKAYEELGYPGQYFNDRLIQAIDDMLAAPELSGPVRLVRPKVLYQFADETLEARSAGQKIMMRMGQHNELRVKAKLQQIRQALLEASERR
jgi:hypothetical protein